MDNSKEQVMDHAVGWMEFAVRDFEKAAGFYSKVFDWKISDFMEGYKVFMPAEDVLCGGIRHVPPEKAVGTPPCTVFIEVADIEAKLAEIAAAGLTIAVAKMEVSAEVGWVAFFLAPGGVMVGLHQHPQR